jgi:transcriptional regulator with XRE-family HTH domain
MSLRKQRGWSQERLAHESGLGRSYVGSVERGERNISLMNIAVLAKTLEVRPATLLDFDTPSS